MLSYKEYLIVLVIGGLSLIGWFVHLYMIISSMEGEFGRVVINGALIDYNKHGELIFEFILMLTIITFTISSLIYLYVKRVDLTKD